MELDTSERNLGDSQFTRDLDYLRVSRVEFHVVVAVYVGVKFVRILWIRRVVEVIVIIVDVVCDV